MLYYHVYNVFKYIHYNWILGAPNESAIFVASDSEEYEHVNGINIGESEPGSTCAFERDTVVDIQEVGGERK